LAIALRPRPCQNPILVSQNEVLRGDDVATRIAARTVAKRSTSYTGEVRRLLDAALDVIGTLGCTSRARVADIVAAAGLSNDAFYRHFPSKDALVAALLEDGTDRLASYVGHQMAKETTPEGQIRRWVEGVLSQTKEQTAATTLAVLWNGGSVGTGIDAGRHNASAPLGALLHESFAALGSTDPELHASLAAHATVGKVADYLWAGEQPTRAELDRITQFCIAAATPRPRKR
jgi:AcrR family transcriptional regulator